MQQIAQTFAQKIEELKDRLAPGKSYKWLIEKFTQITNKAIFDEKLHPTTFRVYCVLVAHLMKHEKCFPSYQTIGREIGKSRDTAMRQVKNLIKKGYIKREKRRGKSNYYIAKIR